MYTHFKNYFLIFISLSIVPSIYAMKRQSEENTQIIESGQIEQFQDAINCALNPSFSHENWKEAIKNVLEKGFDINCVVGDHDSTGLMRAVESNNEELFNFLIDSRANINASNSRGFTPLHSCVEKLKYGETFNPIIFENLLKLGANLHAEAIILKETPLYSISQCGSADLMKLAIKYGADINKKDATGCTCLAQAILNKRDNLIEMLCDNGALLGNIDDYTRGSAFHLAVNLKLPKEDVEKLIIYSNPYHKRLHSKTQENQLKKTIITIFCAFNHFKFPIEIQYKILLKLSDDYLYDYLCDFNEKLGKRLINFEYHLILPLVERRIEYIKTVLQDVNKNNQTAAVLLQTNNQNKYAEQLEPLLNGHQLTADVNSFKLVFPQIDTLDQNNLALRICRRIEEKLNS